MTPMHMQVEKLRDEGVQLKMLQTGLALMQCPLLADNEVGSLSGLGHSTAACLRLPLLSASCCEGVKKARMSCRSLCAGCGGCSTGHLLPAVCGPQKS